MPMKYHPTWFRIATSQAAVILCWFSAVTIFAEATTPRAPGLTEALATRDPGPDAWLLDRPAAASLRGDLLSDIAFARAAPILKSGKAATSSDMREAQQLALTLAKQSVLLARSTRSYLRLASMLRRSALCRFRRRSRQMPLSKARAGAPASS